MATTAAHWPQPGEVIPDAVQNVPGEPPFIYPFRWFKGDRMRAGMGTIQYALDQQVRAGALTPQEALESAQNSGISTGPGGYEPPTD